MTLNLNLPRVLVIAPKFFGYENDIVEELIHNGWQVDLLPDRPFDNSLMKAILRLRPEFGGYQACDNFFIKSLEHLERKDYSMILVIQGEGVTQNTLAILRKAYPRARLIFYTWDSIENKPFFKRNLPFYEACSTFDPVDARKYGMNFRPLFFTNSFDRSEEVDCTYNFSFVGTVHSDRYKIVQALLAKLPPDTKTFIYLYLQAPWMYDFRRSFTNTIVGSRRRDFRFTPLDRKTVRAIFFTSLALLDIEHTYQRGATLRTMEALGSRRKLITTNASIRNYDFYDPRNIKIINRKDPNLDQQFLNTPYEEVPKDIRLRYSLSQWVKDVCCLKNSV